MSASLPPPIAESTSVPKDQRNIAMFCHLLGLVSFIPLGNIIAPLVLWLMKREESSFVDHHGKECLNFQISMLLYLLISFALWLVVIGFFVTIALAVFDLAMIIFAAIKAQEGVAYRYPLCIRFIR